MLTVNIASATGFSPEQLKKVAALKSSLEDVLNSDKFRELVLKFSFDGRETFFYRKSLFGRFIDPPHTNAEVYAMIMAAVEMPGNTVQNQLDLYLVLLQEINPNVVGYGNPGSKEIYTYQNWFESFTIAEYAGHITHEWCHKLGFDHSFHYNRKRKYSVPYAIGDLVEELIEKT